MEKRDTAGSVKDLNFPKVTDGHRQIPHLFVNSPVVMRAIDFHKKNTLRGLYQGEIVRVDTNLNGYDIPMTEIEESLIGHPRESLGTFTVKGWVPPHTDPNVGFSYILVLRAHRAIVHAEGCEPLELKAGMFIMLDTTKPHRLEHGASSIFTWAAYDNLDTGSENGLNFALSKILVYLEKWDSLVLEKTGNKLRDVPSTSHSDSVKD